MAASGWKYRWERRVLDVPSIAFSFVMGDFVVERRRSGDTELVVAFNRHTAWRQTARERERGPGDPGPLTAVPRGDCSGPIRWSSFTSSR